ncbi:MAG: VTC domain-containing protein [Acidobacteriota bacterium]
MMKNRLEYKYIVPVTSMDRLRTDLLRYLNPDSFAALRPGYEYTVRSVYLDSSDYKCFYEKLDGLHERKKFRIRGYNTCTERSQIFFEIKQKHDNFISKSRAKTSFSHLSDVLAGCDASPLFDARDMTDYGKFFFNYHRLRLEPKALIVYDREAYECKFGSQLRITFDKYMRSKAVSDASQMYEENGLRQIYVREFVLEVKFFQVLPQWIKTVLEKYDLTRLAASKYASSIDAQQPASVRFNRYTRPICN